MSVVAAAVIGSAVVGAAASNSAAKKAAGAQNKATAVADRQAQLAEEQYNDWKTLYRPKEEQFLNDAWAYDTPERRAQAVEQAGAQAGALGSSIIGQGLGAAQRAWGRRGEGSSVADKALMFNAALNGAAQKAGLINTARTNALNRIDDMGWARKQDALALGKGMASNAASGLSQAAQTQATLASNYGQNAFNQARMVGTVGNQIVGAVQSPAFQNWWNGGVQAPAPVATANIVPVGG